MEPLEGKTLSYPKTIDIRESTLSPQQDKEKLSSFER